MEFRKIIIRSPHTPSSIYVRRTIIVLGLGLRVSVVSTEAPGAKIVQVGRMYGLSAQWIGIVFANLRAQSRYPLQVSGPQAGSTCRAPNRKFLQRVGSNIFRTR